MIDYISKNYDRLLIGAQITGVLVVSAATGVCIHYFTVVI
jgi:hypothetical protein